MDVSSEQAYPTPLSNSILLPLLLLSLAQVKHTPRTTDRLKNEYDYIIVGGGAAGSVIASRLSEDPKKTVLLLEAGGQPPLLTEVPGYQEYFLGTSVDWKFKTVPQKHGAHARKEKKIDFNAGKMLGGSSNHNDMYYVRGNRKNYDDWAAQGAVGWSYKDVFPYFIRIEDFRVPQYLWNGYHGRGGPLTVELPHYTSELNRATLSAITSSGSTTIDANAERQTGYYDVYRNMRNGQRCSPVKGYLVPSENRTNLHIFLNAMVTKLIIEGNEVKGVQFSCEGKFYTIEAGKEVIVSAGCINSPKLLMLSGIGPRDQLQKFGIPVIADLPVGKNFHDHSSAPYYFTIQTPSDPFWKKLGQPEFINEYIWNRSGPLSYTGSKYGIFSKGLSVNSEEDFPNAFTYVGEPAKKPSEGSMTPEVYKQFMEPYENHTICACYPNSAQPKSRGTIELSSTNPYDPPLIDPNYLAVEEDLYDLIDGIKICKKIIQSTALLPLRAKPFETIVPGCERYLGNEDEYLKCYARSLVFSSYHGVGSCKMGHLNDPSSVLDPQLRVKSVKRLRVVDASVMPIVPSGSTHIPTVMIAEKASDMIKMEYK